MQCSVINDASCVMCSAGSQVRKSSWRLSHLYVPAEHICMAGFYRSCCELPFCSSSVWSPGACMIPMGRTLWDQCILAALSSSAVNSTGITHGMAAGGIGIRGRITDIGTGTLTGRRVDRQAVDQPYMATVMAGSAKPVRCPRRLIYPGIGVRVALAGSGYVAACDLVGAVCRTDCRASLGDWPVAR